MNSRKKNDITAWILYGFGAIVFQAGFIREFLAVFNGNELYSGIVLAVWLLSTASGSFLNSKIPAQKRLSLRKSFISIGIAAPVSFCMMYLWRLVFHIHPGEIANPSFVLITALCTIPLLSVPLGYLFPEAVAQMKDVMESESAGIRFVYILESLGSLAGGLIFYFIFLKFFTPFIVFTFTGLLFILFGSFIPHKSGKIFIVKLISIPVLYGLFTYGLHETVIKSGENEWFSGLEKLKHYYSIHGRISITEEKGQFSIYRNGNRLYSTEINQIAEEYAHLSLIQHPAPVNILIIDNGFSGIIKEALKHPSVQKIDYLEYDAGIINAVKHSAPIKYYELKNNNKVNIVTENPYRFLSHSLARYEAIILTESNPFTAQENRFFTKEFFNIVKNSLTGNGVFFFGIASNENFISFYQAQALASLKNTLDSVFTHTVILPGNTVFFSGSKSNFITSDNDALKTRFLHLDIPSRFVDRQLFDFRLDTERRNYLLKRISDVHCMAINSAAYPVTFIYFLQAHFSGFNSAYSTFLITEFSGNLPLSLIIVLLTLLMFIFPSLTSSHKRRRISTVYIAILITGFAAIGIEVIVIITFQTLFGSIYSFIVILITLYMAGLAAGAFAGLKCKFRSEITVHTLILTQLSIVLLCIVTAVGILFSSEYLTQTNIIGKIFSAGLLFVAGITAGLHFLFSGAVIENNNYKNFSGRIYGIDLAGASAGALLTSMIIIPVFGTAGTALFLAALLAFNGLQLWIIR